MLTFIYPSVYLSIFLSTCLSSDYLYLRIDVYRDKDECYWFQNLAPFESHIWFVESSIVRRCSHLTEHGMGECMIYFTINLRVEAGNVRLYSRRKTYLQISNNCVLIPNLACLFCGVVWLSDSIPLALLFLLLSHFLLLFFSFFFVKKIWYLIYNR